MSGARCIGIGLSLGIVLGVALHSYALAIGFLSDAEMRLVQKRRACGGQN